MLMPSVLIIEDDEVGRRAIASCSREKIGKSLRPRMAIPESISLFGTGQVILCDLLMPKSNGFRCRTIRQQLQPTRSGCRDVIMR